MENKKLRPSLYGGYPWEGIKSLEVFPNRIRTEIEEGKVVAHISHDNYPDVAECDTAEKMNDFYLDRLHDYNCALTVAENQIRDLAIDHPFLPEDFGFEKTDWSNSKIVYKKDRWIALRGGGTNWIVSPVSGPSKLNHILVDIPSAQIAFITLRALGVIKDEDFEKPVEVKINVPEDFFPPEESGFTQEEWESIKAQRKLAEIQKDGEEVADGN